MIYYGYRRGDNDKTVDWSSVSSDITERLGEVEAQRAAQREKLEGEIAAAQQSINDIPMGNYEDINNFMLKFSNTAAEQMRVNNALLRSGQMKPSEYTPFRQNVMDAAVSYKKIAENYNGMMDEFTLRQQEGKAGELEAWQAGLVQQMADLSNTVPVIDPVSGKVFNAPIGADGKPDMKKAMAVRDMQNMAYQKYDRFDMNAQLDPIVEKYGKEIRVLRESGVLTKSDILQRKFGDKSMSEVIDETIKQYNPEQMASVLLDFDQGYKVTDDPSERDADPEKFILVGKDGRLANRLSPDLTEEQQAKARQIIKDQLLTKLDLVETPMATTAPSSTQQKRAGRVESAKGNMNLMAKLFQATSPSEVNEVLATYKKQLTESVKGFKEARVVGNELVIEYDNPEYVQYETGPKTLEQKIPMPENFREFVETVGPALTGNQDLIELYDEAIIAVDNVEGLTRGGATGAFKITSPMPEFSEKEDVIMNQFDYLDSYRVPANRNENYISVADKYFEEFDVDGEASVSPEGVMTITANGITETVKLAEPIYKKDEDGQETAEIEGFKELKSTRRRDLKNALKRIHNKLRKGATGGGLMSGF
jgi:hypothetical protein